jgi:hypothetical protein
LHGLYCTVKVALRVVFPYTPQIVNETWEETFTVDTVNVVLFAPGGIVAVDGTVATDVRLLLSETTAPAGGAAPFSVRVAVEEAPPVTVAGFKVSDVKDATLTVRVVVLVMVPYVAERVTEVEEATPVVVIGNVEFVAPAGIVTV